MRRKFAFIALLVTAVLTLNAAPASADTAVLRVTLTGAAERPGPGDPDGSGTAFIFVDDEENELCLVLFFRNVTLPTTGLHIHEAPPTDPGPIVVGFTAPTTNVTFQCRAVEDALLDDILANPEDYYLNLHTVPNFAAGAIRGQLERIV